MLCDYHAWKREKCVHSKHGHSGRNQCGEVNKHVKKRALTKQEGNTGALVHGRGVHDMVMCIWSRQLGRGPVLLAPAQLFRRVPSGVDPWPAGRGHPCDICLLREGVPIWSIRALTLTRHTHTYIQPSPCHIAVPSCCLHLLFCYCASHSLLFASFLNRP